MSRNKTRRFGERIEQESEFSGQTVHVERATPDDVSKPDHVETSFVEKDSEVALSATEILRRTNEIPKCRQCPICWDRFKGKGIYPQKSGRVRYYRCDQCGNGFKYPIPSDQVMDPAIYDDDV